MAPDHYTMRSKRLSPPGSAIQTLCSIVGSSLFLITVCAEVERSAQTNTIGFTTANAANQQALETKFDARLDPADQRAWLERMSAEPNHVGSLHDKANAEFWDRIRFAVLKLSAGNLTTLQQEVDGANRDWRDTLVAAGFGESLTAHKNWFPACY